MKENRISIIINKSQKEVFEYSTNPINTHKWFESIAVEKSTQYPPELGTKYMSHSGDENWGEYTVTNIKPYEVFELTSRDNMYHVRYTYTSINANKTKMEYWEWVDEGSLDEVVEMSVLTKLKNLLED